MTKPAPCDRQMPWEVAPDEPKQIQEEIVRLGVGCERMEFDLSADELDRHYAVNLKGTTMLTMEFIRRFKYREGGRIINLTSGQSLGEMSQEIVYALTKAAVETLTKTISQEIAKKGITIIAVNPGPTDTGWMDEDLTALILSKSPMGRVGTPRDTA
ncbi:SDR family NAD(P)-dependent oxidoreductase [Geofilum rhodophaeum]|uniref:SDR family NAD(P)-dependent oxidoreductase n=1 Tax=Geofilum rhodophaeum TaxID=1965019 RepID=UPI00197AA917|nr:SDR family NAD(P)-dependent oxidoreductase [Geofilum rhodophaeum]